MVPESDALDSEPERRGRMAGEYLLGRKLGAGGFGSVYEAEHPLLKRRAAVKVLHRSVSVNGQAVLRFMAEARAANRVPSRHIVDVFSCGQLASGEHFYVMDLLEGLPLDRVLTSVGRLELGVALNLLCSLAQALDALHAAGVVHRDLKPQNIFLAEDVDGVIVPKLLDFGLAKLLDGSPIQTESGRPIGTPLYMAPEQCRGEALDQRADIYAFGVLCYELLTGTPPLRAPSTAALLVAHLTETPPRLSELDPTLPAALDAAALVMLAKQPSERPATAGAAFAQLVDAAARAGSVPSRELPRSLLAAAGRDQQAHSATASASGLAAESTLRAQPSQPSDGRGSLVLAESAADTPPKNRRSRVRRSIALAAAALALAASAWTVSAMTTGAKPASFETTTASENAATRERSAALGNTATREGSAVLGNRAESEPLALTVRDAAGPAAPASSDSSRAEAPRTVLLTVRDAPADAQVFLNGERLGTASAPLELAASSEAVEVTISAHGHTTKTLHVVPKTSLELDGRLPKLPPVKQRPKTPSDLEYPF